MSSTMITVSTTVQTTVTRVWEIYTNPVHIIHWNNASEDWHTPNAVNDLRIDGKFDYRMEAKDGSAGFNFSGIYIELKQNELISYIMDDGRKAVIIFAALGNSTKIKIDFEAELENT